ncbi:hypothetical protein HMPREF1619_00543 [Klebsiella pneumoniae 909957]|nr:hypothetical protein HMPREF1619_00543 [Klebsiella pneumoniae 909957]
MIKLYGFIFTLPDLTRRVVLRGCCQCDKHTDLTLSNGITLNPYDSVFQL